MWIEARQIVFHHGRGVALRIDRDEKSTGAIRILAERAQNLGHVKKRGRANVGAMRKAEEYQVRLSLQVRIRNRISVLVDELERSADRRGGRTAAAKVPGGVEEHSGEDHQAGQKS
jgi:hypothetical protein